MVEDGDDASDERRLMGEKRRRTTVYVAGELGLVRVDVAAAQVGQYTLIERGSCLSVATSGDAVVVGTDEHVSVLDGDELRPIGFGPTTAVGIDEDCIYAASPAGRVARLARTRLDESTGSNSQSLPWESVGSVDGARTFDGDLLATEAGLFRVDSEDGLVSLGLEEARDVTRFGPIGATAAGVFQLEAGDWQREVDGDATAVVTRSESAHAIVDGNVLERSPDGNWQPVQPPTESEPRLLAYSPTLTVLTADGTVWISADPEITHDGHGGWRSQAIGVPDATEMAVRHDT